MKRNSIWLLCLILLPMFMAGLTYLPCSLVEAKGANYVISADSSLVAPLPTGKIAFVAIVDDWSMNSSHCDLLIINADGSNLTRLTYGLGYREYSPAFSSDSNKIVFTVFNYDYQIYLINADGTGLRPLTLGPGNNYNPAWSPDGNKIVFVSDRDGNPEIYLMNADGSGQTRLTNNSVTDDYPSYKPDGTRIIFTSLRNNYRQVCAMDPNGTNVVQMTASANNKAKPVWAPNGSQIAFTADTGADGSGGNKIFTINPSGTNEVQLTTSNYSCSNPAWSPDSAYVLYDVADNGTWAIYRIEANGANPTLTINYGERNMNASWSTGTISSSVVTTGNASNINQSSANLNGHLNSLGTASSAEVSFELGTTSGNYIYSSNPSFLKTPGYFFSGIPQLPRVPDLTPNTTYYFRAKAILNGITSYGIEHSFTTQPANPVTMAFTNQPVTTIAGQVSNLMIIQAQDAWGFPLNVTNRIEISLVSSSVSGKFDTSAIGSFDGSIRGVTIVPGSSAAGFYYKDTIAGTPIITATAVDLPGISQTETVNPALIDHYSVSDITSPQVVGTGFTVTLQAQDIYNNTLSSGSEAVNISPGLPDSGITPGSVMTSNGAITINNFKMTIPCANQSLIFTGVTSGKTGASNAFDVNLSVATKLVFTTTAQTIIAGSSSKNMTLQIQDSRSNPVSVTANLEINLASSSATGKFDTRTSGTFNGTITKITIPKGSNSVSFYYKDTTAGTPVLTASSSELPDSSQQETINPATLSGINIYPANSQLTINAIHTFTAQGHDKYNNVISGLSYSWSVTNNKAGNIDSKGVFIAGQTAGTYNNAIQVVSGLIKSSAGVTILPETFDHYAVSLISTCVINLSFKVTIQAQDKNNNNTIADNETLNISLGKSDNGANPLSINTVNGTAVVNMKLTTPLNGQSLTFTGVTSAKSITSNTFNVNSKAPSSGGGGIGLVPTPTINPISIPGWTASLPLKVDASGRVQSTTELTLAGEKLTLDIAQNTQLLDASSNSLKTLTAIRLTDSPSPPPHNNILLAYQLGPEGAHFEPGLVLNINFSGLTLPTGTKPEDLRLAYWDGSQWKTLASTVDLTSGTIRATVLHFSQYALMVTLPPEPVFTVSNLSISPQTLSPDTLVTLQVMLANIGDGPGADDVILKINGNQIDNQVISLDSGKNQTVTFQVQEATPGMYQVEINGSKGSFRVEVPSPTTSETANPSLGNTAEMTPPPMTNPEIEASSTIPGEIAPESTEKAASPDTKQSPKNWIILGIIAGIIVVAGLVLVVILIRRK